ncbi:MAG: hypothetical protein ABIR91_01400 [Candidatus Saccharimonadales bacterium]
MPRRNQRPIHTPFHFVSNCQSKRRFATEKQAQDAADHQMLIDMDLELSVYKCDICGGWHLTRAKR